MLPVKRNKERTHEGKPGKLLANVDVVRAVELGRRNRDDADLLGDEPAHPVKSWMKGQRVAPQRCPSNRAADALEVTTAAVDAVGEDVVGRDLEARHVDEEEVGAVRPGVLEPEPVKDVHEDLAPGGILFALALEELLVAADLETVCDGLLCEGERRGGE